MTREDLHQHNRYDAVHEISYQAVCTSDAIIEFRRWITKWLEQAYEAGYNAGKEGKI